MPKASVDEYRHATRFEHNIGSSASIGQHGTVDTEPKPAGVQQPPKLYFGLSVLSTNPCEPLARAGGLICDRDRTSVL